MYGRRRTEDEIAYARRDVSDYIRDFVLYMRNFGRVFDLRNQREVQNMLQMLNEPNNTSLFGRSIGDYQWGQQRVDFVPSNLGRGFLFYFRCMGCNRRTKYLYAFTDLAKPLCHHCCRLKYRQPGRKERDISRLLRKPYLSGEAKYTLIKRTGITIEDVTNAAG